MEQELYSTSLFSDANLRAYYRAENVNDATSNGYNLTNTNSVAFNAAKFNNGFDFGSSNTTKRLNTTSKLGIDSGAMSIVLWVKFSAEIASGIWALAEHSSNVTQARHEIYYQYNGGTIGLLTGRTRIGVVNDRVSVNGALGDGNFHHIAYVYDGSAFTPYVDGVAKTGASSSGNGNTNGTDGFAVGNTTVASLITGNGIFDDVAVFDRALTAAEVKMLYQGSPTGGYIFIQS